MSFTQASYDLRNASHSATPIESELLAVVVAGDVAGLFVAGAVASLFVVDSDFAQPTINTATTRIKLKIIDLDMGFSTLRNEPFYWNVKAGESYTTLVQFVYT